MSFKQDRHPEGGGGEARKGIPGQLLSTAPRPVVSRSVTHHLFSEQSQSGVQVRWLRRPRGSSAPSAAAAAAASAQLVLDARLLRVEPLQVPPAAPGSSRAAAGGRIEQPAQALGQRRQARRDPDADAARRQPGPAHSARAGGRTSCPVGDKREARWQARQKESFCPVRQARLLQPDALRPTTFAAGIGQARTGGGVRETQGEKAK